MRTGNGHTHTHTRSRMIANDKTLSEAFALLTSQMVAGQSHRRVGHIKLKSTRRVILHSLQSGNGGDRQHRAFELTTLCCQYYMRINSSRWKLAFAFVNFQLHERMYVHRTVHATRTTYCVRVVHQRSVVVWVGWERMVWRSLIFSIRSIM